MDSRTETGPPPQHLSDDRVRHLITRAALRAASAVTATGLLPMQRLATLMECHAAVAAARGPLSAISFSDFRALVTAGRGPEPGRSVLETLLPAGVEPLDFSQVTMLHRDGEVADDMFDVELEQRMLMHTLRKLGAEAGAVSDAQLQSEIEQETAYALLKKSGRQQVYENGRQDLIKHPAAAVTDLSNLRLPPLVAAFYQDIGYASQYQGWWFSCPVCKWPMRVLPRRSDRGSGLVRCWHGPHAAMGASYLFDAPSGGAPPVLHPEGAPPLPAPREAVLAPVIDAAPQAVPTAGHKAVVRGIWRYTTVPGLPELALYEALRARGLDAQLWPGLDAFDLQVPAGAHEGATVFTADVKDYTSGATLGRLVHAQSGDPGGAGYLVVPDYRASQVPLLDAVCRRYRMHGAMTASDFGAMVCAKAGVVWA